MAENPEVRKDEPHCFFADPDEMKEGPTPPPTDIAPGSQAKLDVLQWRAQHGYARGTPKMQLRDGMHPPRPTHPANTHDLPTSISSYGDPARH